MLLLIALGSTTSAIIAGILGIVSLAHTQLQATAAAHEVRTKLKSSLVERANSVKEKAINDSHTVAEAKKDSDGTRC